MNTNHYEVNEYMNIYLSIYLDLFLMDLFLIPFLQFAQLKYFQSLTQITLNFLCTKFGAVLFTHFRCMEFREARLAFRVPSSRATGSGIYPLLCGMV